MISGLFSKRLYGARRGRMSAKKGNKDYYKGSHSGAMGAINQYGSFTPDPSRIRRFVVPQNLGECGFYPYVSHTSPKVPPREGLYDVEWYYREALQNDGHSN